MLDQAVRNRIAQVQIPRSVESRNPPDVLGVSSVQEALDPRFRVLATIYYLPQNPRIGDEGRRRRNRFGMDERCSNGEDRSVADPLILLRDYSLLAVIP